MGEQDLSNDLLNKDVVAWLIASLVAAAVSLVNVDSVYTALGTVPFGNDAFYHAARAFDAAGERGFYQFDPFMHVPEGSWVSWPWAYDYLLSRIVAIVQWISPGSDPMDVLVLLPVVWIPVNAWLLLSIARQLELRTEFKVLALLGFALLPTTQTQHGIGQIDHHFLELFFVLLVSSRLLHWLRDPSSTRSAVLLGLSATLSLAFHHGLFILQLPVLAAVGLLWLKDLSPPSRALRILAATIFAGSLLVALPSGPFREMQFNMTTLSWFHVYIGTCVAVMLLLLSWLRRDAKGFVALVVLSIITLLPMLEQVTRGADFLSGQLLMLDEILEMNIPWAMATGGFGPQVTLSIYSLLLLLVPFMLLFAGWRLLVSRDSVTIAYSTFALIGLGLLLMQYRLNYFGSAFMLLTPLLAVELLDRHFQWKRHLVLGVSATAFLAAFQPPLTGSVFNKYPAGGNILYETVQPLMPALAEACDEEPGIVLANAQFGHYIRYHTDCSVIVNNFLIDDLHFQKVEESNMLFTIPAELMASGTGGIRYVFVMLADTHELVDGKAVMKPMADIAERNPKLIRDLMFGDSLPPGVSALQRIEAQTPQGLIPIAGVFALPAAATESSEP